MRDVSRQIAGADGGGEAAGAGAPPRSMDATPAALPPTHSDAGRRSATHPEPLAPADAPSRVASWLDRGRRALLRLSPRTIRVAAGAAALVVVALGSVDVERDDDRLGVALSLPGSVASVLVAGAALLLLRRRLRRADVPPALVVRPVALPDPARVPAPAAEAAAELPATQPSGGTGTPPLRHLLVRTGRTTVVVDVARVTRIEADGRYVRLVTAERTHLAQYTLADLERRLDPATFVRIHRSTIVNLRCIRRLRTDDYRDFDVQLTDGSIVRMSRTYRARVEAALEGRGASEGGPGRS